MAEPLQIQVNGESRDCPSGATVGDLLKISTGGRSKVVTVSAKDRSAIMMGGHLADGAAAPNGYRLAALDIAELCGHVACRKDVGKKQYPFV